MLSRPRVTRQPLLDLPPSRLAFFLTFTFAGSGFYYNVGNYSSFQPFAQSVLLLFQCFFM